VEKPSVIGPRFESFPAELKSQDNWVLWRSLPPKREGAKWRKVPFQANGKPASTTDPTTWNSFIACCEAYNRGGFDGLGYVFDGATGSDGLCYVGLDFDSCITETTEGKKEVHSKARERLRHLDTYTERSVSGTGFHCITRAQPLERAVHVDGVEIYSSGRYFTFTGQGFGHIRAAPVETLALVKEVQAEEATERMLAPAVAALTPQVTSPSSPEMFPSDIFTPADRERIRRKFGHLLDDNLSAGIQTNIEEIRSAVSAIPPTAIATEPDWVKKLARPLAREARCYPDQAEELWEILDTASRASPGYDEAENRRRWLRYMGEALDHDKPITIATVFDLAKKHGWKGWSPPAVVSQASPTSSFGPTASPATGLDVSFSNIRHRQWLYGTTHIRGEITVRGAPGGVGKSTVAICECVSVATGRSLLDEKVIGNELRSAYMNAEDSRVEVLRRTWACCLKHGLTEQDLVRFSLGGADDWQVQGISFLRTDKSNSVLDEAGLAHLEKLLEALRPDLFVIDPLVAFCGGGNINDNAVMALLMRALKRLAYKFDCAILIIHHTKKGGDLNSAEAISGASAVVNFARRAVTDIPMSSEEAKALGVLPSERWRYFKEVSAKSNLAPRSDDATWYQLCSIELPNPELPTYPSGDGVQAVERVKLPLLNSASATAIDQNIQRAILDTVDRGKVIGGQAHPYSPNVTGAQNQRALIDDAMAAVASASAPKQWHRGDLRALVERAIAGMTADGWLTDIEITAGRFRRCRGLQVDWSSTPWASTAAPTCTANTSTSSNSSSFQQAAGASGQWSMTGSMIDQLPKQGGGGQLPPFKGGIDRPPPPTSNNRLCSDSSNPAGAAAAELPGQAGNSIIARPHAAAITSEVTQAPAARSPRSSTLAPPKVAAPRDLWDDLDIPPSLARERS
jgi:AAA domain